MSDNPFDLDYREAAAELDDFAETPTAPPETRKSDHIVFHDTVIQGSDEWLQLRCGVLTASEMKHIITATGKVANNDKTRAHAYELAFQRITQFVEPQYVSDAMLRGQEDEIYARAAYSEHYAEATETGFITNNRWGFTIGYSPDGLVGDDGLIECKSRMGKYQVQTIATDEVPDEYMLQLQTGLLVTERKWIDFVSYCGGLPVFVKRVESDPELQEAIINAATAFEARICEIEQEYRATLSRMKLIPTERREMEEIIV